MSRIQKMADKYPDLRFDKPETWPDTWKERCEIVASLMRFSRKDSSEQVEWTWSQVFNSSPTGELYQVHCWFMQCALILEAYTRGSVENQGALLKEFKVRQEASMAREFEQLGLS